MPNEQALYSEEAALILRALEQSSQPLTVTKLGKALPKSALKSKQDLPVLLQQMVKGDQIRCHKARSSVYWLPILEGQARERMLEAFGEKPLTQTELKGKFKSLLVGWPVTKREEILAQLVEEKRVCKLSSVYWTPNIEEKARERIVKALTNKALTKKALYSRLSALLPDWPTDKRRQMFNQLKEEKLVYKLPPLTGKSDLFSASPDDPRVYLHSAMDHLQEAINILSAKLEAKGVARDQYSAALKDLLQQNFSEPTQSSTPITQIRETRSLEETGQVILEGMQRLDPAAARGSLVSLTELRRFLRSAISDKESFDQAILHLVEQDRVALSRHVFPGNLSQEERDMLVSDERGIYYVGIALTT